MEKLVDNDGLSSFKSEDDLSSYVISSNESNIGENKHSSQASIN